MKIRNDASLSQINKYKLHLNTTTKVYSCAATFHNLNADTFERPTQSNSIKSFKSRQKITKKILNNNYIKKLIKNFFAKTGDKGLTKLKNIKKGKYGTKCNGSKPLTDFAKAFKNQKEYEIAVQKGRSTNTNAFAFSFLKSKSDRPLSTSGVYDCSTIYFYNDKTKTHALYHYYPETSKSEFEYMIKILMPEGYTKANIVPGIPDWINTQKQYLPEVFDTIKEISPKCKIDVFHNMSKEPEIVGYKGIMYQIKNKNHPSGQATFKISDSRKDTTLIDIHYAESIEDLNTEKERINRTNFNKELKAILNGAIFSPP